MGLFLLSFLYLLRAVGGSDAAAGVQLMLI